MGADETATEGQEEERGQKKHRGGRWEEKKGGERREEIKSREGCWVGSREE